MSRFSEIEIERFLDEALSPDRMAAIEEALRGDDSVRRQLAAAAGRRDAGVHSLGGIWGQHRLSCPSREQLGSYLLEVLDEQIADYVAFHLNTIGCRYCQASAADLREQHSADDSAADTRRKRYFQSSAGYLAPED